ncbi:uncharacterized protein BO96DRAFT_479694 [Aspergillus niger CBS 101883]|uniref:Uncharacterized protein n=2 Tax=Aspergillus niger TaxID=5061 RepID=A5AB26_ASPNC|nr:uncharacterized protein BO96DRAFT_479694 [Aspergillus niger CBS 101883]XP_059606172.1 hypothetical protein An08g08810 [Aspergillus niger]PYH54651.1 hypothetical protein BO96DRAFT_479694 [Aspergillus niger CBS 101883]CAK96660.1 hypothetical protein An08g08810 [Aspergillus niger]
MAVAILHQTELSSCAACGFYRNGNYEAIECQSVWQLELAHIPLIPAIWDCTCSMGLTSHVKRANSQACRRSPSRPTGPEFIRGEPIINHRIQSAATQPYYEVLCRKRYRVRGDGDTRARVQSVDCIMKHAVGSRIGQTRTGNEGLGPFPVNMPAVVSLTNSVVKAKNEPSTLDRHSMDYGVLILWLSLM